MLNIMDIRDIMDIMDIMGFFNFMDSMDIMDSMYITPIMDINDYKKLITNLKKNNGVTDFSFRKKMAHKIYKGTSSYDKIISDWFNDNQK